MVDQMKFKVVFIFWRCNSIDPEFPLIADPPIPFFDVRRPKIADSVGYRNYFAQTPFPINYSTLAKQVPNIQLDMGIAV